MKTTYAKLHVRGIFLIIFFITNLCVLKAQNDFNPLSLTLDIAGNSGLYSINGEYLIKKFNGYTLNARAGFGYMTIKNAEFISLPLGANLFIGTGKHHVETGLGMSYIKGMNNARNTLTEDWYESEGVYFIPIMGYRYDKLKRGMFFKIYYSPQIVIRDFLDKYNYVCVMNPEFNTLMTREDFYNQPLVVNAYTYPQCRNNYLNFGVTVGYRF